MNEYRLLIVDADLCYTDSLRRHLEQTKGFSTVLVANNGLHAFALLNSMKPDIVLMNPHLPGLDGFSLLKEIHLIKRIPVTICLSEFFSQLSIEMIRRNGADYFLYKPIDFDRLAEILLECAATAEETHAQENKLHNHADDLNRTIHALLSDMGFSGNYSGISYIAQAAAIAFKSPAALRSLSNDLYPRLSERNACSSGSIERCIRTSIAAANTNNRLSLLLGCTPTNKTCIAYIVRKLNAIR